MAAQAKLNDTSSGFDDVAPLPVSAAMRRGWMSNAPKTQGDSALSANELASLSALISYVAHQSGGSEFGIERRVADRFNIPNVKCLPALQFDDAIRYLVDGLPRAA